MPSDLLHKSYIFLMKLLGIAPAQQLNIEAFSGRTLHSGIQIESVKTTHELTDVLGRPATGFTSRVGKSLQIILLEGLSPDEQSVTMYHEIIEAAMGAHFPDRVPVALQELNEAQIDALAQSFHTRLGPVNVRTANQMLRELGF